MAYQRTAPYAPRPGQWPRAKNLSALPAPCQGIMQLTGADADDNFLNGRQPAYGGITMLGIIRREIPSGKPGRIISGIGAQAYVTVELEAGQSLAAGDRVGAKGGSWYACKDMAGPMRVDQVIEVADDGLSATALVTITGRRTDHVFTRSRSGDMQVAAQTWYLKGLLRFREISPGHAEIYIEGS